MLDSLLVLVNGDATTVATTTKERLEGIEARLTSIDERLGIAHPVKRPSLWTRIGEHKVVAGLTVAAIIAACGLIVNAFHSQANQYLDNRIHIQVSPVTNQLSIIDGRTSHIEGELSVLRAELVGQKYSSVKPQALKEHRDELNRVKTTLAKLPPTSPGYWPAAFQVIQLFSQSNFIDMNKIGGQIEFSDVSSRPAGRFGVTQNRRVFLRNHVEGLVFKDCIVSFDPTVELVNDVFINCVFILPAQESPSKPLQEIGKILLASDLAKVILNAS
jgi:hypothetical protein